MKKGKILEIVFYSDGNCYYNFDGISHDCNNLIQLKKELNEKFDLDFVKSKQKPTAQWDKWKTYYHLDV